MRPTTSPRRILIVTDEPNLKYVLQTFLLLRGFEVHFAAAPSQAFRLLGLAEFDVLTVDLDVPGIQDEELWQRLGAEHPEIAHRCVFLSVDPEKGSHCACVAQSGTLLLAKPVAIGELLGAVERLAAGSLRN